MANETRRGPGRPRRQDLSEQQRRVLDLLVDGKTNGEIGEALGISLDGAKYHVTAICDRIGVETREEAAEWWRQKRGLRARFAVSRGWIRLPVIARLAIGGTAGVAVVAGVIAALVMLSEPEDGTPAEEGMEPGLWVAVAAQAEPGSEGNNEPVDMTLAVHGPGGWKDLGETRYVVYIALSPDAQMLAMVEWWYETEDASSFRSQLVLVDTQSGERQVVDPSPGALVVGRIIGWSPDSQLLAVEAGIRDQEEWTVLLSPEGTETGRIPGTRGTGQVFPSPAVWSADSRMLLLEEGESLVVARVTGEIVARGSYDAMRALAPTAIGWQPTSALPSGLAAYAWTGEDTFTATLGVQEQGSNDLEAVLLEGRIDGGEIAWEPGIGGDVDAVMMNAGGGGPYPDWVTESRQFAGSRTWAGIWHRPGMLSALLTPNDVGTPPGSAGADARLALFVEHDGQYRIIDLDLPQDYFWRPRGPGTTALEGPQVRWDAVVVE